MMKKQFQILAFQHWQSNPLHTRGPEQQTERGNTLHECWLALSCTNFLCNINLVYKKRSAMKLRQVCTRLLPMVPALCCQDPFYWCYSKWTSDNLMLLLSHLYLNHTSTMATSLSLRWCVSLFLVGMPKGLECTCKCNRIIDPSLAYNAWYQ